MNSITPMGLVMSLNKFITRSLSMDRFTCSACYSVFIQQRTNNYSSLYFDVSTQIRPKNNRLPSVTDFRARRTLTGDYNVERRYCVIHLKRIECIVKRLQRKYVVNEVVPDVDIYKYRYCVECDAASAAVVASFLSIS